MSLIGSIIVWIVFGTVIGIIARFLMPGPDTMSWFATISLGVAGSFVGGFIGRLLFGSETGQIEPAGYIGSVIGAIILLIALRQFRKSQTAV